MWGVGLFAGVGCWERGKTLLEKMQPRPVLFLEKELQQATTWGALQDEEVDAGAGAGAEAARAMERKVRMGLGYILVVRGGWTSEG